MQNHSKSSIKINGTAEWIKAVKDHLDLTKIAEEALANAMKNPPARKQSNRGRKRKKPKKQT